MIIMTPTKRFSKEKTTLKEWSFEGDVVWYVSHSHSPQDKSYAEFFKILTLPNPSSFEFVSF